VKTRVLLETSCLRDARRVAGIGRYTLHIRRALEQLNGITVASVEGLPAPSEARPIRFAAAQPATLKVAATFRPHLLHGVSGEATVGFPLERQVITLHDVEMWHMSAPHGWRGAGLRGHRTLQARLLRGAGAIITPSTASADDAAATLTLDRDRIHVVPHGVSETFGPVVAPYDELVLTGAGVRRDDYLLWVGSLRHHDPRKALGTLIEAVAALGREAPPLALVGAVGEAETIRLRQLARTQGIRLALCGPRSDSDLAALYRHALCLVISSRHEGFGLPALEAMASGCAVVATDAGNLPELLADVGRIAPVDDAPALGAAIAGLLNEPLQRARLRQLGTQRASEFTWSRAAVDTAYVYRQLLS